MTSSFSVPSNWHKDFFTNPVIRFWDAVIPPQATKADLDFIQRHIGVGPPATIADIPCGTGRHAIGLAREGYRLVALDASDAALEFARLAAGNHPGLQFLRSDMLSFEMAAPVDGLICMGNSIGYGEPALTRRLLRRFASMLRAGGRLILDTGICAESLLPLSTERRMDFPGGWYEQEIEYDTLRSIIKTRAHLVIDGASHELKYRHFVMTSGELVRIVRAAGFDVLAMYGDTGDAAFAPGSPRLLLVAVKAKREREN